VPVVWDDVQAAFARQRRPLPAGVIVHAWQGGHAVARTLAAGTPTLASPQEATYLNHRATGLRSCYAWDPANDGCGALPAAAAGAAAGLLLGGAAAGLRKGPCAAPRPLSRSQCPPPTVDVASGPRALMRLPERRLSSLGGGQGLPRAQSPLRRAPFGTCLRPPWRESRLRENLPPSHQLALALALALTLTLTLTLARTRTRTRTLTLTLTLTLVLVLALALTLTPTLTNE